MADNNSVLKYAVAGVGAIALGALVWYLSKDDFEPLDYTKYDKVKLEALMKELELEITCIYARNYTILLRVKENGEDTPDMMNELRTLVEHEIRDKKEQVVEDYCFRTHPKSYDPDTADYPKEGITVQQFDAWVEHFDNEPFMNKQRDAMMKLHEDLFVRQRIEQLTFGDDIPEELTGDKYLLMYKKIWATLRHDLYKAIVAKKKDLRVQELDESNFNALYNDIHKRFEMVRQEVYAKIMDDPDIEQEKAREYM